MDSLGMPAYWPYNHIPVEFLWASNTGTTFRGQRGDIFFKLIRIIARGPITISASIKPTDSNCQVEVRGSNTVQPHFHQSRIIKVLWYNAAQPNPGRIEALFPFQDHLAGIVQAESPDVLLFSSTGAGVSRHLIGPMLTKISHTQFCQQDVGIDGGVFSVSHTRTGNLMLNPSGGNNIESGVELIYNWY